MSVCKGCGSPIKNCGAPIWEDVCTNKDCTYDAHQFKLQMRKHGERMRKDKALRDAAPDLYEALDRLVNWIETEYGCTERVNDAVEALAKARGESQLL